MITKEIGKIASVSFGYGGYQDAMFGLSFSLGGKGWSVSDFKGTWGLNIDSKDAKWTEEDRDKIFAETVRFLNKLLIDSKKRNLSELKNVPIEATFEDGVLKDWRILTEVI